MDKQLLKQSEEKVPSEEPIAEGIEEETSKEEPSAAGKPVSVCWEGNCPWESTGEPADGNYSRMSAGNSGDGDC